MSIFSKKPVTIPSKAEALPGRAEPMPVPEAHFVNKNRITPPFPSSSAPCSAWRFGAGEEILAAGGVYSTAAATRAGRRPTRPIRSLQRHDRVNEVVLVVFDPRIVSDDLLKVFQNHDPTQNAAGNDVGTRIAGDLRRQRHKARRRSVAGRVQKQ
jgi:peptide-methionine (S)-S-oxide reductase